MKTQQAETPLWLDKEQDTEKPESSYISCGVAAQPNMERYCE
jgi:hypothetical protein